MIVLGVIGGNEIRGRRLSFVVISSSSQPAEVSLAVELEETICSPNLQHNRVPKTEDLPVVRVKSRLILPLSDR